MNHHRGHAGLDPLPQPFYNRGMQIGIIGDIHGAWDDKDTAFFNAAEYPKSAIAPKAMLTTDAEAGLSRH